MRKTYREPGTMKRRIYHLVPRKPLVPSIDATTLEEEPDPIVRSTSPPFQSTSYVEEKVGKWWLDTGSYPSLRNYDGVSWVGTLRAWVLQVGEYLQVGLGTPGVDLTGIYIDSSQFRAQNAGTTQVWIDITTGKFYAGAGDVGLDASGLWIRAVAEGILESQNKVRFVDEEGTPIFEIYGSWPGMGTRDQAHLIVPARGENRDASITLMALASDIGDTNAALTLYAPSGGVPYAEIEALNLLTLKTPTELTISGGAITATQSNHIVDTQGDAATDDLDTINGGVEGMLLFLRTAHNDRDVTIKNGTGNITCGADFTHDRIADQSMYRYDAAIGAWLAISLQSNA